ncbi:unnamed protein product [Arctogadus glacialis]
MPYVGQARPRPEQPVCNIRPEGKEGFDSNFALPMPSRSAGQPPAVPDVPTRASGHFTPMHPAPSTYIPIGPPMADCNTTNLAPVDSAPRSLDPRDLLGAP